MNDNADTFLAEDFKFTADMLRQHRVNDRLDLFRAVCSNNINIILAALNIAEDAADLYEPHASFDLRDEVLRLRAERDTLRRALIETRMFVEWPAMAERMAAVLRVIDEALREPGW